MGILETLFSISVILGASVMLPIVIAILKHSLRSQGWEVQSSPYLMIGVGL